MTQEIRIVCDDNAHIEINPGIRRLGPGLTSTFRASNKVEPEKPFKLYVQVPFAMVESADKCVEELGNMGFGSTVITSRNQERARNP